MPEVFEDISRNRVFKIYMVMFDQQSTENSEKSNGNKKPKLKYFSV